MGRDGWPRRPLPDRQRFAGAVLFLGLNGCKIQATDLDAALCMLALVVSEMAEAGCAE